MTPADLASRINTLYVAACKALGPGAEKADFDAAHADCVARAVEEQGWTCWQDWPGSPAIQFGEYAVVELRSSRISLVRARALREGPALVAEDGTHVDERGIVRWMRVR